MTTCNKSTNGSEDHKLCYGIKDRIGKQSLWKKDYHKTDDYLDDKNILIWA